MSQTISRRGFLKGGIAAACTVAASTVPVKAEAGLKGTELATLVDISRCIGCESCVDACTDANSSKYPNPKKPYPKMYPKRAKVAEWSDKTDVNDRLTPYNWIYIQSAEVEVNGEELEINVPRRCMHCSNPPCVKLCPFGAAYQFDSGISRIDKDLCFGGAKCKGVCPWKIPQRQTGDGVYLDLIPAFAGNGIMTKCDRCYDRIADGKKPACIEECPEEVQIIGPRDEIIKEAHKRAKEMKGYIYGEKENGGTNTIYVSPVPFSKLNKAVEKGPGRPHFKPVKNSKMDESNNIVAALLIAPAAGAAAAFAKFYKFSKSTSSEVTSDE